MEGKRHFLLDVDDLLKVWEEACTASFSTFRKIWKEMLFSFIHEGRPKDLERKDFMQMLYAAGLEVIAAKDTNSLAVRAGALYLLYLLFETQPGSHRQRVRIYMSPGDLTALRDLVCGASREHLTDVVAVANRLIQSGAFLFGAVHSRLTPDVLRGPDAIVQRYRDRLLPTDMLEEHFEQPLGDLLPLTQMDHQAREYNQARKRMVAANRGPSFETEDPPYISLAEDLLRSSAALDRQVCAALAAANPGAPARARSARPRPDVNGPLDNARSDGGRAAASLGNVPADMGVTLTGVEKATGDVSREQESSAQERPGESPGSVEEVVPEVAPLPVQSMPSLPSIPGFFGGPAQPMETEPPGSPPDDEECEIDEDELRQGMDAVDAEDIPDPTARPGPVLHSALQEHGQGEQSNGACVEGHPLSEYENGDCADGQLGLDMRSLSLERRRLVDDVALAEGNGLVDSSNGVLDRRRTEVSGVIEAPESSDSDDDMNIRMPLPRALSPLR